MDHKLESSKYMGTARLVEFREPTSEVWGLIKSELLSLEIVKDKVIYSNCEGFDQDNAWKISIENAMQLIKAQVIEDYKNNLQEEINEPWEFSYIVDRHSTGNMEILTKLSSKDDSEQGSVYYGIDIFRVDKEEYLLDSSYENQG